MKHLFAIALIAAAITGCSGDSPAAAPQPVATDSIDLGYSRGTIYVLPTGERILIVSHRFKGDSNTVLLPPLVNK